MHRPAALASPHSARDVSSHLASLLRVDAINAIKEASIGDTYYVCACQIEVLLLDGRYTVETVYMTT
jgi:hypothetical protein